MAGGDPSTRQGEHRIRFVERHQPVGVPGVGPLDEELSQVLRRARRPVTVRHGHVSHLRKHGKYSKPLAINR